MPPTVRGDRPVLDYSRRARDRMAVACAVVATCVGAGGNVWGGLAAWSLHGVAQGSTIHSFRLEGFLFFQAVITAALGVGFGLAALMKGRGRVGVILLACLGMHLSLTPYLVSNAVLDHIVTKNGLVLGP